MTTEPPATDDALAALHQARRDAAARLASLVGQVDDVVAASAGSNADDEHDPEGATIAFERAQLTALVRQVRSTLAEIDQALVRADDGRYGRCTDCGETIAPARLEALPATPRCLPCARLAEADPSRSR